MDLSPFSVFGLSVFGKDLFNTSHAVPPDLFVGMQQAGGPAKRRHVAVDDLLPPASLLGDECSPFQNRHVLLHRREAHGKVLSESRHRLLLTDHPSNDVATRGVRQGVEDMVGIRLAQLTYNHMVVG